jgi:tetratricopeptide (TPR) repeat protein
MKTFKTIISCLLLVLIVLITALPCAAQDDATLTQIAQANSQYAKGQYKEAADLYQDLVDRGIDNGYLYYNLANAYLRLGKTGPSILNYIRAKKLLPRDESLAANLKYAIQRTEDQLEPQATTGWSTLFFWTRNFNQNEHLKFLLTVNLLFWLALGIWTVRRTEFWSLTRKTFMAILIVAVLSFGVKIGTDTEFLPAVVMAQQIEIKSAQGVNNVTLFQLHEGAVVTIIARKNDWVQIELNDGKKGWTQEKYIGV